MKLNIHIIYDELQEYSPQINTKRDIELTLRQVRFVEFPLENLQHDCIYILDGPTIKEHAQLLNDIDIISIGSIDFKDEELLNLSAIILNENCSKTAVFNKIQDIFEKYELWNYNLMHNIAAHESLEVVADYAASILKNPFAILDVALKRIAKGGDLPENYEGTIWELVMEKGYTPSETFSLSNDDLYSFLGNHKKPYSPNGSPYTQYSDLMVNLYIDDKLFAFIATTSIYAPFTQEQISLLQHIRNVLELAIAYSIEFKGSTEVVNYYLERLIKGFSVDDKIISYHLKERGWNLKDQFRVYTIANPDGRELEDNQAEFCLYRIKNLHKDVISFSYENFIIVITRNSKRQTNILEYQKHLTDLLSKLGLHCGFSNIFDNFSELKYYYIQSKAALCEGEKNNPDEIIWNFDDYYFSHLINSLDNTTSLTSMCHPNVLRLYNHDEINDTDFVQCLRMYLYNGCNIAQTGKSLFMHRNTLIYRLEKIADIIEMDVRKLNEYKRMQLWVSCLICSYL